MKRRRIHRFDRSRPLVWALYLNAALLSAVLLVLLGRDSTPSILPSAYAQNQLPIAGGAGVFIVPAQFGGSSYGCYLMDVDRQTICVYQFSENKLRLKAARSFEHDRKLKNYNTDAESPEQIKRLVELEEAASRVKDRNTDRPAVEAPPRND